MLSSGLHLKQLGVVSLACKLDKLKASLESSRLEKKKEKRLKQVELRRLLGAN